MAYKNIFAKSKYSEALCYWLSREAATVCMPFCPSEGLPTNGEFKTSSDLEFKLGHNFWDPSKQTKQILE